MQLGQQRFDGWGASVVTETAIDPISDHELSESNRRIIDRRIFELTALDRTLDALRAAARSGENTMYPLLDCVRAYATVGEMCDALRDVWGVWRETPVF